MKRLANVWAILVPMGIPLICLNLSTLNSKMLWFKINFNMVSITCRRMDGCMVDCMNRCGNINALLLGNNHVKRFDV